MPIDQEVNQPEGRKRFQVAVVVLVEVSAFEGEAELVAQCAAQWPIGRRDTPKHVQGYLNGKLVGADIVFSQAIMAKEIP